MEAGTARTSATTASPRTAAPGAAGANPTSESAPQVAAPVSASRNPLKDQTPSDMGVPGLNTRNMWKNRVQSPRSTRRRSMSIPTMARESGQAMGNSGVIVPGATRAPTVATRKTPIPTSCRNTSSTGTSPSQGEGCGPTVSPYPSGADRGAVKAPSFPSRRRGGPPRPAAPRLRAGSPRRGGSRGSRVVTAARRAPAPPGGGRTRGSPSRPRSARRPRAGPSPKPRAWSVSTRARASARSSSTGPKRMERVGQDLAQAGSSSSRSRS